MARPWHPGPTKRGVRTWPGLVARVTPAGNAGHCQWQLRPLQLAGATRSPGPPGCLFLEERLIDVRQPLTLLGTTGQGPGRRVVLKQPAGGWSRCW
jgi:hypothetical protein